MTTLPDELKIAVVIPCYRVGGQLEGVLRRIGPEVSRIYVVDDACPEHSADIASNWSDDSRVKLLRHSTNKGVGGAVKTGYCQAVRDGMDVVVKIDGDGQMDPALIPAFVRPIIRGEADYTKGNRFFSIKNIKGMPGIRILGNIVLSFFNKLSSGYWSIFDPANGYTAIDARLLKILPFDEIDSRYFFESDMLFQLGLVRAVVVDIPMVAVYGEERSNLRISTEVFRFLARHIKNSAKRILYNYFLRDFSIASVELLLSMILIFFGLCYGVSAWSVASAAESFASSGSVMLAALPIIVGCQLLISFLSYDIELQPKHPVGNLLRISTEDSSELNRQG